jgi:hypothetical protein
MIKKVERYETDDGRHFKSEKDAIANEKLIRLIRACEKKALPSSGHDIERFVFFLNQNRDAVLDYYS